MPPERRPWEPEIPAADLAYSGPRRYLASEAVASSRDAPVGPLLRRRMEQAGKPGQREQLWFVRRTNQLGWTLKAIPTDVPFVIGSDHILIPLPAREGPAEEVTK